MKNQTTLRDLADKNYQDDIIHKLSQIYEKPSKNNSRINKHEDDEYGIYMNHSFNPNCIIGEMDMLAIIFKYK